jgi:hypothetical protein
MIGERTTLWLIAAGWITAGLSGLLTGYLAYRGAANLNPMNFVDALLLLGLAFGIFRKSRTCAVLALIYYVINQIARVKLLHGGVPMGGLLLGVGVFVLLYGLSIVGTFAWHRGTRPAAA